MLTNSDIEQLPVLLERFNLLANLLTPYYPGAKRDNQKWVAG